MLYRAMKWIVCGVYPPCCLEVSLYAKLRRVTLSSMGIWTSRYVRMEHTFVPDSLIFTTATTTTHEVHLKSTELRAIMEREYILLLVLDFTSSLDVILNSAYSTWALRVFVEGNTVPGLNPLLLANFTLSYYGLYELGLISKLDTCTIFIDRFSSIHSILYKGVYMKGNAPCPPSGGVFLVKSPQPLCRYALRSEGMAPPYR